MVHATESLSDIGLRRQQVASWIENAVKPVEHALQDEADTDELTVIGFTDAKTGAKKPEFEVREYQLDAWGALWDARQDGADRGLIHLATGLGKTSVAVFDSMKFREEFRAEHGRDPKIMFAVHQSDILKQASERFQAFMPDASIGFYDKNKKDLGSDITFATLQSLYRNLDSIDSETFDYIITDEVHHAKATTYEKVVEHFKPQFRLGLTATPNRADDRDIRELYGTELYSKGLAEALQEGWLATPDYHIVFDDAVKEAMQSGFEANSLRALKELFDVKPRNDVIVKNIKEEMQRIGLEFGSVKTIVFCQDIEHAEEMAELLGGKAYHSETGTDERTDVFGEFKNGNLQVITTRDMFNEGVDVPDARLLVFLRSTQSQTIFEQQLGRGLRKALGKERVSVLDFVANVDRIAMVKDLAEQVKKPQGGHGGVSGGGTIIDGPEVFGGEELVIHTNHGDFDFDKMTVDLLEKYSQLIAKDQNYFSTYSNEDIIELARKLSPDAPITQTMANELAKQRLFPTDSTLRKRFGDMNEFHKACGFEPALHTLEAEEIITLADTISPDRPLTVTDIDALRKDGKFVSLHVINKHFGGIRKFNEARGLALPNLTELSNEELIELAKSISDKRLRKDDIERLSAEGKFPSPSFIGRRFGDLATFQEACGHKNYNSCTDDELLQLAEELSPGKPLRQADIQKLSKNGEFISTGLILKRFGGVDAFNEMRGIIDPKAALLKMTNEELVERARELNPDGKVTTKQFDEWSATGLFVSRKTAIQRFGTLEAFHEACGR